MILSANFLEISGQLNHINVCKYLKDLGWNEFLDHRNPNIKVFQYTEYNEFIQVEIPINKKLVDYNWAMLSVVEILSKVEKKNVEQVILELLNPMCDIFRFRLNNQNVENGSILFEDAIKLFENSKRLLSATAMDISSPKIYHKGRVSEEVQTFIDQCRFGQTELGSYVINLVCPLGNKKNNQFEQYNLFSDEEVTAYSFTRRVVNKLMKSTLKVKEKIDSGGDLNELLNPSKEDFVSINYLDALQNIGIDHKNSEIDISVKWAPTVHQNRFDKSLITISNDYYDIIKTKVNSYKEITEEESIEFIGKISDLKSNPDLTKREKGIIKVKYINNDKLSTITAELSKDDYDKAVIAHKNGKTVKVIGEKVSKSFIADCTIEVL